MTKDLDRAQSQTPTIPALAPLEKCRDAPLVILGQAREHELVDVHAAGEMVERVRQAIDSQFGHGD